MQRMFTLASILILIACSGCGDTRESLANEGVSTMKEMVAVLDGVKDEASAKAAKPKLKSLLDQLNSINGRQAKLPAPTAAQTKELEGKYIKELAEVQQKLVMNMMRLSSDPKIGAQLGDLEMKPMKH
jgi:hypothetical protein